MGELLSDRLKSLLAAAAEEARKSGDLSYSAVPSVRIERPSNRSHGDFSTNFAFVIAKEAKLPPARIAEALVRRLAGRGGEVYDRVEVAGPGFVNFFISPSALYRGLSTILEQGEEYARFKVGEGKTVQVEFVSANPTGPLTVGHGRQAAIGDTIANLLERVGYAVTREYYYNDAGNQMKVLAVSVKKRYLQLLGEEIDFGEDLYQGEYIVDIAGALRERCGDSLRAEKDLKRFQEIAEESIFSGIKKTLASMGIRFDVYYNENSLFESGKVARVVDLLRKAGCVYERDGAVWFQATRFGRSKDRVIIKKTGEATYRLPDIAYHRDKLDRGFDIVIDVFGADHHGTFPDVLAGVEALGCDKSKIVVLIHQFVTLVRDGRQVKMSTRKAQFVTLEELLGEVGRDVARYFFLMRKMGSHLDFDLGVARKQSLDNPVYYLQYAHARICSIQKKYGERYGLLDRGRLLEVDLRRLTKEEELEIIKDLMRFEETVKSAAALFEPHRLCVYLEELAAGFHSYYNKHRVMIEDKGLREARLAMARAVQIVLKIGLGLLGVSVPESM